MPYTIDRYSSDSFDSGWPVTIPDNTINTTATSLQLLGRGVANYGQVVAEQFVHILENFAGTSAPANPITGQLWFQASPTSPGSGQLKIYNGISWVASGGSVNIGPIANRPSVGNSKPGDMYFATDPTEDRLYIFDGANWDAITGASQSVGAPSNPVPGQLWFNTSTTPSTLLIWNGTAWTPIITSTPGNSVGNRFTSSNTAPPSPQVGDLWYDLTNQQLYAWNGTAWISISGADAGSTPPLNPQTGSIFYNTATHQLYYYNGSVFVPIITSTPGETSGNHFTTDVSAPASPAVGDLWFNSSSLTLSYWDGSHWIAVLASDSSLTGTGVTTVPVPGGHIIVFTVDGFALGVWSDMNVPQANLPAAIQSQYPSGVNVGLNLSNLANNMFRGTTTSAEYADLAERYAADKKYDFGTVVKLGGEAEVTETTQFAEEDIFGVISQNPGLRLNDKPGYTDETHPFIALSGRVFTKVKGPVKKGQRIVSSDIAGVAQGLDKLDSQYHFAVIGRALQSKTTTDVDLIEIVVGVK